MAGPDEQLEHGRPAGSGGGFGEGADQVGFLLRYDPSAFPPIAVTVDVVLLSISGGRLAVLLIRRSAFPFRGRFALPGGFVRPEENLEAAARRELAEVTGVPVAGWYLEQLGSYGEPDRDPRMRVVSVAYLAVMPAVAVLPEPMERAGWLPVAGPAAAEPGELAFDHQRLIQDGVERACSALEHTSLATSFLPPTFTVADLRRVYEQVWGIRLHPANFRRKVLGTPGLVLPTGELRPTGRGRSELYRAGPATTLHPALVRPAQPGQLRSASSARRPGGPSSPPGSG